MTHPGDVFEDVLPGHSGSEALTLWTGTDAPSDVIKLSRAVGGTVAGVPYTLTFFVENDNFDPNNFINVLWNSQTVLALRAIPVSGFNNYFEYTATVMGTGTTSTLEFDFRNTFAFNIDDVSMTGNVAAGFEKTGGTITFTDTDASDTHTITVTPPGTGYLGTFTPTTALDSTGDRPAS